MPASDATIALREDAHMQPPPLRTQGSLADRCVAAVLILLFFGAAAISGVTSPQDVPDTFSYRNFDFRFPALLAQMRTVGYPLYLELHERIAGSERWVSWGHAVIYATGALVFSRSIPGSQPVRLAVLAGLLGTNIFWLYGATVATDTLAAAMGLLAMGFTFRFGDRATVGAAVGVCLFTVAGWLIRPAMVAVIPAALLTYALANRWSSFRELIPGVTRLCGLLCVPVLLFCSLRLATLGKFGIVSFGGYNLIGVVGQFPSAETAPLSSSEAQQVRERAGELRAGRPPERVELPPMNYTRLEANYDITIWSWYVPAARHVVGDDPTQVNSILRAIGTDILRSSPREYAIWLAKAFRQAVRQTLDDLAESPVGLLGLGLVGLGICVRRSWPSSEVLPLVLAGVLYWASLVGLTILVCPPLGRMTDAAALLLPSTLLACAVDVIGRRRCANQEPRQSIQ